jgi:serine phosphatase RsbU (regulator of sigma subunit)
VSFQPADDRGAALHGVRALTDASLAHLDVEELISTLLVRVKEQLRVDAVTVLLLDPYGQELTATASIGLEEEVVQGLRVPVGKGFTGRVASERAPVHLDHVDQSNVLSPVLISHGIQSLLGVPMIAAGDLVGVVYVGSIEPRHFTAEETELLQVASERLAYAAQTQLAQLDRATTVALQRSLLPARHIELPGMDVAARYVPGAREGLGGDWYDTFTLPSGHVGIVIGDVVGHGLRAAVVMGRIRSALRAYALESTDPADVLTRLDRKISVFEPQAMATAIYAVVDPDHSSMQISVAGHPPPVIACAGEETRVLDLKADLPLGAHFGLSRHSTSVPLKPGELVVFYTDGLIERRDEPLDVSIEKLRGITTCGPAESTCMGIMAEMLGDDPADDDVALLAIRLAPAAD